MRKNAKNRICLVFLCSSSSRFPKTECLKSQLYNGLGPGGLGPGGLDSWDPPMKGIAT